MLKRRPDLWLPAYALTAPSRAYGRRRRQRQLTHVIFLVCDHYEPRHGMLRDDQPGSRLNTWREGYARFQERCRAAFGTAPLHTWFYPPHHGYEHLACLSDMVFDGLGEVELHYHHQDDTSASLRRDLGAALAAYHRWGLLLESGEQPRPSWGFIHGDWALGNSCGGRFCGVNDELAILADLGCWGDFTMPSGNACQTRKINSIYYGASDPRRPKAHDWGRDARVGEPDPEGMFLMQGPLGINWHGPGYPRVENANLTSDNWGRPDRIQQWLDCNVHVKGRPEWLFVKLHTHGAIERDFDALFGAKAFEMHRVLNEQYNDGKRYRLHYVTARQAYNIAKAAEHGKGGDPADWLDYRIPPQPHAYYALNAPHLLRRCTAERLTVEEIAGDGSTLLRSRVGPLRQILGPLSALDIDTFSGEARLAAMGELRVEVDRACDAISFLGDIDGGGVTELDSTSGDRKVFRIDTKGEIRLRFERARGGPMSEGARQAVRMGAAS